MTRSEAEILRELSTLREEYTRKFASIEPITNKPSPHFDLADAHDHQTRIESLEAELHRLRTSEQSND
jgi:hypothetical protein